jgi:hypothetical protein
LSEVNVNEESYRNCIANLPQRRCIEASYCLRAIIIRRPITGHAPINCACLFLFGGISFEEVRIANAPSDIKSAGQRIAGDPGITNALMHGREPTGTESPLPSSRPES